MDSLNLNSEGISYKRPKTALKRKRATDNSSEESLGLDLDILRTYEDPSETIPRRMKLYDQHLEKLEIHLNSLMTKFNNDLDEKLNKFIGSSFQLVEKMESVIPIGILESGLSVGETSAIFQYIKSELLEKFRNDDAQEKIYVSRVQSCTSSSAKAVFQHICREIITEDHAQNIENSEEDDVCEVSSPSEPKVISKRGYHYSLYDLKSFLSSVNQNYKIVIIIEDIDYFANSIITQLLTLIGCAKLPIIFIVGATHGRFIQNLIPLSNSSAYVVDKFYTVSPQDRLDDFMKRVFFNADSTFRVSGPIVSYLESQYKENNFSVELIFNSIKFCLRYHFLTGKSTFCSLDNSTTYSESDLKHFEDLCRGLNSTAETPRKRSKVKFNGAEELDSAINGVKSWQFFLRLLSRMNFSLPDRPLGDTFARIYANCYDGYTSAKESDETEPLLRFFKTIGSLSKADLQFLFEDCVNFLEKQVEQHPDIDLGPDILKHFKDSLADLVEGEKEIKEHAETSNDSKRILKLRKGKSLKELQESILEMKRQKDGSSVLHETRNKFVDSFSKLVKKCLKPFNALKSSDIFVFSDLNLLINAMYPANFLQLNEDIISPGYILKCKCCSELDQSSIDAKLPDVCIIHKLLCEHTTKKVDLNMIYHAFLSVVQPTTTGRKSKASKDTMTASYLVRFRRAVGELQHMGFVKRSKSKPDEISRLTWW